MGKAKTLEQYKEEVKILGNDEYEVLSPEYLGNKVHLEMLHKTCGFKYLVKPNYFISGNRCPKCAGKVRKDTDYFKQEVYDLVSNEYEIVGEYINNRTKITFRHKCGNIFDMTPHNFLSGQRCPKCQHRSYRKTTDEFKEEVFKLAGDEYTIENEYINGKTKIMMRHHICGNTYMVCPSDFLQGYRCPHCYGNLRKTQEEFEEMVANQIGEDYQIIGRYKNMTEKILMKHLLCGYEYMVRPRDIISHQSGCPKCNMSKGEMAVEKYLKSHNIKYEAQKRFDDCKNIHTLPFDFYIEKLNTAIEYDGQLHYMSINFFGGENALTNRQKLDGIKTNYCKEHNIKLIRIPYYDYDKIEEILSRELEVV